MCVFLRKNVQLKIKYLNIEKAYNSNICFIDGHLAGSNGI